MAPSLESLPVGPLDALWHLLNFFAPAVGVGALAAALTKLVWFRDLRTVAWTRLAGWAIAAGAAALVTGLLLTGRDGSMVTYGGMVAVIALSLGWVAFRPRRG